MRNLNTFKKLAKDQVYVRHGETRSGPFPATVQGDKIIILCLNHTITIDIQEGDTIERQLPSGRTENYTVWRADYNDSPFPGKIPSNWDVHVEKKGVTSRKNQGSSIHIEQAGNIQIGDHNVQNIVDSLTNLVSAIERSESSDTEKAEAKNKLGAFLRHPLVVRVLGAGASTALDSLTP